MTWWSSHPSSVRPGADLWVAKGFERASFDGMTASELLTSGGWRPAPRPSSSVRPPCGAAPDAPYAALCCVWLCVFVSPACVDAHMMSV
jgi:hypothetical protein